MTASNIYRQADAPNYRPGHGVVLAYLVLFLLIGSLCTHFYLEGENKKRQSGKRDAWSEGKSPLDLKKRGDMRPDFLYIT